MKMLKQLATGVLGLIILTGLVRAEDVPALYEARVPVESQDREERDAAIQAAFREVLVRVSGRHLVLTVTSIEQALEQANRYVQQQGYQKADKAVRGKAQLLLWVRFDKQAVDRLLHDNRLPVWGRTRPATLIWLAVDDRRKRVLLSNDMDNQLRQYLDDYARQRGIPVRLPLMDLADRSAVGVSDVWGNFEDNLLQASERYQPEAILVGRVARTTAGTWSARWSLYQDGRRQDWTASAEALHEVIRPGIDQVADTLAERFARLDEAGGGDMLLVKVKDIRDLGAYDRVVSYLDSLSAVSRVQTHSIQADSVVFILSSRSGRDAINRAISLGHTLAAEAVTPVAGQAGTLTLDLQYRLLP